MELIDKAAVVAELERLYNLEYDNTSNLSCGKKIMLRNILLFLDTLEVKEVDLEKEEPVSEMDLEKEVRKFIKDNCTSLEEPDEFFTTLMQLDDMVIFAKYFYELGLNAKKGE